MPLLSLGGLAKKNGRPGSPGSLSSGSSRTSRASQTRTNRNSPLPTQEELQKALDILKSSPAEVTKPVARQIPPKVASQLKKWLQASRASAAIKKQDTVEGQADLVTLHDEAEKARIVAAKSMGVDPQSGIHNTTIDARHNETYALRPGDARPQTTPRIPRPASRGGL